MDPFSTAVRSALTLGFTASGVLSGTNIAISLGIIPAILPAPKNLLIQEWRALYQKGSMIAPPFALFAFANLAFVAYSLFQNDNNGGCWQGIAIAAITTVAIVPFTLIFAQPTIDKLMAYHDKKTDLSEREVKDLVQEWSNYNAVRAMFPLAATGVGLWSALA